MGEYVVIPAQSRGAVPAKVQIRGNPQNKSLIYDDTVGVTTVGDASEVLVGKIKGECEIRAELFHASSAFRTGAV
jgi:hypothetical protein